MTNLVGRQFGRDGDGWIGLRRTTPWHSQTGRVFSVGRRQQVTAGACEVGSASELAGSLAVAASAVRPVLGLHELVVERTMTSRCGRGDALSTLRHPQRIDHVVRRYAAYHLHHVRQCQHSTSFSDLPFAEDGGYVLRYHVSC